MHTWHTVVHIHAHTGLHVQVCKNFSKNLFSLHLFSLSSLNKSARSRRAIYIFFFRIRSHARFSPGTSPPPPNPLPPLLPPSTVMCSWTILRFGISRARVTVFAVHWSQEFQCWQLRPIPRVDSGLFDLLDPTNQLSSSSLLSVLPPRSSFVSETM